MTGIEETNQSEKAFLLDLHETIFSFVKQYFVGVMTVGVMTLSLLYKKQAHFSQLFCLQVRSVTP